MNTETVQANEINPGDLILRFDKRFHVVVETVIRRTRPKKKILETVFLIYEGGDEDSFPATDTPVERLN